MKNSIQLARVILIGLALGIAFPVLAHAVTLPFLDGFETYAAETYPSPPWVNLYSGRYAQVSTEQAYSGDKSFMLVGRYNWSRSDAVNVIFPENFTFSFAVMIAPGSNGGTVGIAKSWGGASPVNAVNCNVDGNNFNWEGPVGYYILLDECVRGKWYHVSVTIRDFSDASPTADVTITHDGTSVTTTDIPAYNRLQANRNLLQLHTASRAETRIYFDDICIAEQPLVKSVSSYVVLGQEGIWLKDSASVLSGNIGVRNDSDGPFPAQSSEVAIGPAVQILDSSSAILGDRVKLMQGTQVYDVYYNDLSGLGEVLGDHYTPLELPLRAEFPSEPVVTPGTTDVDVPRNSSEELPSGSYGTLTALLGSTVTFTGGVYNFESWDVRDNVTLNFTNSTEIRVEGRLSTGVNVYTGPAPSATGIDADDIIFFVIGINGSTGNMGATPKAAKFGLYNTLNANVYAPNGTLWIRQGSTALGSFLGKWVVIGPGATLDLLSAW